MEKVPESFQASDQGRTHRSMAQTEKGYVMGIARYEIVGMEGAWRVRHDGTADNSYATKEAAFEAAIAAASLAIRQGHEVIVTAPASETATASPAT